MTAETHFSTVAPQMGTQTEQAAQTQAEGATPGNITITAEASNPDTGWTRGWVIDSPSTAKSTLLTIKTDYTYQEDQYKLGTGLYMYTSRLTQSTAEITDYEMIIAVVDIGGVGYQLMVAKIAADDQGEPSTASSSVYSIGASLVKFFYTQSK